MRTRTSPDSDTVEKFITVFAQSKADALEAAERRFDAIEPDPRTEIIGSMTVDGLTSYTVKGTYSL